MTKTSMEKKKPRKKKITKNTDFTDRRKEWRLELPLPVKIEGELPQGNKFKETTAIKNISSKGVYFTLDSGVIIGSKLNLVIDLPKEISGDKNLKLRLGGLTVRLERATQKEKKQGVALRFHEKYEIIPDKKEKK